MAETTQQGNRVAGNRSGRVAFRRAVLRTRGGECQCLPNVFGLQFGIVPERVVPVWIDRHGFHHPTHRQPHAIYILPPTADQDVDYSAITAPPFWNPVER